MKVSGHANSMDLNKMQSYSASDPDIKLFHTWPLPQTSWRRLHDEIQWFCCGAIVTNQMTILGNVCLLLQ